jgi:hypothetical protein
MVSIVTNPVALTGLMPVFISNPTSPQAGPTPAISSDSLGLPAEAGSALIAAMTVSPAGSLPSLSGFNSGGSGTIDQNNSDNNGNAVTYGKSNKEIHPSFGEKDAKPSKNYCN